MSDERRNPDVKEKANWKKIWPLMLLPFVSILVYGHCYKTGFGPKVWYAPQNQADFFLYYKMWFIIILTVIMLIKGMIYFATERETFRLQKKDLLLWIPLAGYFLFSFLSTCFSDYAWLGWKGGYEEFESIWVVLGYCVIAFYAYLFVESEADVMAIMKSLVIASFIVGVIGAFQKYQLDFFKSDFMTGVLSRSVGSDIKFNFSVVYSTLYNPNYVGLYGVVVIPLMIMMVIKCKNPVWKIAAAFNSVAQIIAFIGSFSKTALVMLGISLLLLICMNLRSIKKYWYIAVPGIVICGVLFGMFVLNQSDYFVNRLKTLFVVTKQDVTVANDIVTKKDCVAFRYLDNWIEMHIDFEATDEDKMFQIESTTNQEVSLSYQGQGMYTATISEWPELKVQVGYVNDTDIGFRFECGLEAHVFACRENGYQYMATNGAIFPLDTTAIERAEFLDGYEHIASHRGYIWSRTIPLLKQCIVFGFGRDSFIMAFPHEDIFGRNTFGYGNMNITKPHNLFLQLACQDGIIATGLCITFFILVIFKRGNKNLIVDTITVIVIGFALCGITTDSTIGVTPILYLLVGIKLALCRKKSE